MKTKLLLLVLACFALPFMGGCDRNDLSRATERGDVKAQIDLYFQYLRHRTPDESEIGTFFLKSANAGGPRGQLHHGLVHLIGYGVPQDQEEAVKWLRKSAEQGQACAFWHLGWCYRNGEGVTQNEEEAVKWLHKAKKQGIASPDDILNDTQRLMRMQK